MGINFVAIVWGVYFGICCRNTGKVEFLQLQEWREKRQLGLWSGWNSSLQTDPAVNLRLNFWVVCNLKLIVTWDVQRVGIRMCVFFPPLLSAGFELNFHGVWPVLATAGGEGTEGLSSSYFWSGTTVENKAWVFQRGKCMSLFQCNLFVFLSVITIFALGEVVGPGTLSPA